MPARSNDFQRLVLAIEKQLGGSGAKVEESVFLPNTHTGAAEEVDILITSTVGERQMRIAVECRDHKRRADKKWIDELHGRYALLPVDKVVAVSRRGFSKTATLLAKLWNIELLSLSAAQAPGWARRLGLLQSITVREVSFETPMATILCKDINGIGRAGDFGRAREVVMRHADGRMDTVQALLERVEATPAIQAKLKEAAA